MTQNKETLAKNYKNNKNSQLWKTSLVTGLGLVAGAGTVVAMNMGDEDEPVDNPEENKEEAAQEQAAQQTAQQTAARPAAQHAAAKEAPKAEAKDDEPEADPVELPEYVILEHEVVTLENGSQVEVGMGITAEGHLCAIIDEDMDGKADKFLEDLNDNGEISDAETVDLAANNIHISMEHLPELTFVEPEPIVVDPNEEIIVVPDGDDTLLGETGDQPKPENDDDIIVAVNGQKDPDYTNNAEVVEVSAEESSDNVQVVAEEPAAPAPQPEDNLVAEEPAIDTNTEEPSLADTTDYMDNGGMDDVIA